MIGLHRNETRELFIHLTYFTFLIVINVMHISMFHKKYTKQFMWRTMGKGNTHKDRDAEENNENVESESQSGGKTFLDSMIQSFSAIIDVSGSAFDWICCLLEIQSFKIVLVLGFVMSISEVCGTKHL